jgi:hypothetical protein
MCSGTRALAPGRLLGGADAVPAAPSDHSPKLELELELEFRVGHLLSLPLRLSSAAVLDEPMLDKPMSAASREVAPGGRLGRADTSVMLASHKTSKSVVLKCRFQRLSALCSWTGRCLQLLGKWLQGGVLDEPIRSWQCHRPNPKP